MIKNKKTTIQKKPSDFISDGFSFYLLLID